MESNLVAQRAARRFMTERVRSDWDWPNVPECWSASDEEVRGVGEFRERFYGESATESEPEVEDEATSPYQFDSPDTVGDAVEQKTQRRKRKRRAVLESEMSWNEGLACFVERRDVWTGVAAVRKYGTNRPAKKESSKTASSGIESSIEAEDQSQDENLPVPGEMTPPTSLEVGGTSTTIEDEGTSETTTKLPSPTTNSPDEPLTPVALPFLADNHIRAAITPKSYPDIYSKIVVTGRAPAVPINLADMTRALVGGWKESGEWPPKATPLDPLVGRKKVMAVDGDGQFLSHHPHMKRGMDSVKRIFHLNGHHHEDSAVGNNG